MWADGWTSFDTETTGLRSSARVVEIGVVTFEKGVPVREWSSLLKPENVDWDDPDVKKALEINKLERAQLEDQPTFEQILPDLLVELAHDVWVAHNLEFDARMLKQEMQRLGRPPLTPPLAICTKNVGAALNKTTQGNHLYEVAGRYNVVQENAHRAIIDAKVCGLILAEMHRRGELPTDDVAMRSYCEKAASSWRGRHRW